MVAVLPVIGSLVFIFRSLGLAYQEVVIALIGAAWSARLWLPASAYCAVVIALMLLLFGLVLRAVSLEMRSKRESMRWRRFWDGGFFVCVSPAAVRPPPLASGSAL